MTNETTRIVLDVWGGECSMDHVARHLPTYGTCWALAEKELRAGYLVNLRQTAAWGSMTPFDDRDGVEATEGALQ
jgi:hypothetical protein